MQLYYQTHSPYARKVLVLIHELGLAPNTTVTHYETSPTERNDDVFNKNPLGKVPILVLDGCTLYDSSLISRYLIEQHAEAANMPAPSYSNLQLEALATGMADAGILARWELKRRPEEKRYAPFLDGQLLKLNESYDYLERYFSAAPASNASIGNIALATSLTWIEFVQLPSFRLNRPSLSAWLDEFSERSSMQKTGFSGTTVDLHKAP